LDPNELTRLSADSLIAPEKLNQRALDAHKIFTDNVVKPDEIDNQVVVSVEGNVEYLRKHSMS
jgi:hypothetical protein